MWPSSQWAPCAPAAGLRAPPLAVRALDGKPCALVWSDINWPTGQAEDTAVRRAPDTQIPERPGAHTVKQGPIERLHVVFISCGAVQQSGASCWQCQNQDLAPRCPR